MPNVSFDDFDFEIDALEEYDPLDETEIEIGSQGRIEGPIPTSTGIHTSQATTGEDTRSAAERIVALFDEMKARRRVLLDILRFLAEPKHAEELDDEVERLQEYDFSVFTAVNYSDLLESAGAIAKCSEQGEILGPDFKQLPEIVEIDGIDYYKPADEPVICWVATPEGRDYLEQDKPFERLMETIDSDRQEYLAVYRHLLAYCDVEAGRTTAELEAYARSAPAISTLDIFASRFTDRLERCSALRWAGTWKTTEIGRQALERYADDDATLGIADSPEESEA